MLLPNFDSLKLSEQGHIEETSKYFRSQNLYSMSIVINMRDSYNKLF